MIHIFSIHFKDDKWADIQLNSIKKYIKVPYKTYAVYSHMSEEIYNKRRSQYDYFLNKEIGKHTYKKGKYHQTDGHGHMLPLIKKKHPTRRYSFTFRFRCFFYKRYK